MPVDNIVARPLILGDSGAEYRYPVARQQSRDETEILNTSNLLLRPNCLSPQKTKTR
jgi:hypothetical protein